MSKVLFSMLPRHYQHVAFSDSIKSVHHSWNGSSVRALGAVKRPAKLLFDISAMVFCKMDNAARLTPMVS